MRAFDWVVCPDARVLRMLVGRLRQGDARTAFATAGEALAGSVLSNCQDGAVLEESRALADAMVGSLMLVEAATSTCEEPDRRCRLAMATTVLSVARPHAARACDGVVSLWIGSGIGSPRRMSDPYALAARVLLALLVDDAEGAADCADALNRARPLSVTGVLHDWTVARLQHHGAEREAQCFHHLRVAMAGTAGEGVGAALLLVGAVVAVQQAGQPRARVRAWLEGVAADVERAGTTRRAVGQP
jgi:hypothetical protein